MADLCSGSDWLEDVKTFDRDIGAKTVYSIPHGENSIKVCKELLAACAKSENFTDARINADFTNLEQAVTEAMEVRDFISNRLFLH